MQTTDTFTAAHPQIARIRRKLERWELDHLREHAADLAARLERLEDDLRHAEERADYWHAQCTQMVDQLMEDGEQVGLTPAGELVVLEGGAA